MALLKGFTYRDELKSVCLAVMNEPGVYHSHSRFIPEE